MDAKGIVMKGMILGAALALASPAAADTWWETEEGTFYFNGGVDGWGEFVFIENGQVVDGFKVFIDEMEDVYYGRSDFEMRSYVGYYAIYDSNEYCSITRLDPYGNQIADYGEARMTFQGNWQYFTLELTQCADDDRMHVLYGMPGQ